MLREARDVVVIVPDDEDEDLIICPECDSEIEIEGAQYCSFCGSELEDEDADD
jgi:DNA-directed RNA polymerase subunit RPC12/RpoP